MNDYYQVMWHAKTKAGQDMFFTEVAKADILGKVIEARISQEDSLGILSVVPANSLGLTKQAIDERDELNRALLAGEEK